MLPDYGTVANSITLYITTIVCRYVVGRTLESCFVSFFSLSSLQIFFSPHLPLGPIDLGAIGAGDDHTLHVHHLVLVFRLAVAPLLAPTQPRLHNQVTPECGRNQTLVEVVVPRGVL